MSNRTSLSAGMAIRAALLADPAVYAITRLVEPIEVPAETQMPYIVYKRTSLGYDPVKGAPGPDTAYVDILCIAADYGQSVEMAESVRRALDGKTVTLNDGYTLRRITFSDADEGRDDCAFIQSLSFAITV